MSKAKDLILADAIKTAIKVEKQNIILKRVLIVSALLNVVGVIICVLNF